MSALKCSSIITTQHPVHFYFVIDQLSVYGSLPFHEVIMRLSIFLPILLTAATNAKPIAALDNLKARNTASSPLYLLMKPAIIDPQCGNLSSSTISVQYADDEFYLSKPCLSFLDLIGGMKGNMAADVLFLCASGQTSEGTGEDEDRMKVAFFTSSIGPDVAGGVMSGTKDVGATMQVTYVPKNVVLEASTTVNGKWDTVKDAIVFESIICN